MPDTPLVAADEFSNASITIVVNAEQFARVEEERHFSQKCWLLSAKSTGRCVVGVQTRAFENYLGEAPLTELPNKKRGGMANSPLWPMSACFPLTSSFGPRGVWHARHLATPAAKFSCAMLEVYALFRCGFVPWVKLSQQSVASSG